MSLEIPCSAHCLPVHALTLVSWCQTASPPNCKWWSTWVEARCNRWGVAQSHMHFGERQVLHCKTTLTLPATSTLISSLCRYLDSHKETEGDGRHLVYKWGARAKEELDPEDILRFVAKVCRTHLMLHALDMAVCVWQMHEMDVEVWRKQYEHHLQGRETA